MSDFILAFDFGGTKLSAAVIAAAEVTAGSRAWHQYERVFSPVSADAQYDIATMVNMGKQMLSGRRPAIVGVSFGGPVDYEAGMVRLSHHVPGWENAPLQAVLEAEFGVPVVVDNDANAAALGEYRFGAGQGVGSMMYITVSTGVGGGWVLNGRLWRGHEGMAGEIGHTVVDPLGPLCLCGKRGCVERLASGPYMAGDLESMRGQATGTLSGQQVAAAARAGDADAIQILDRGARALGVGIGNAANFVNPALFVLGGGVTKSGDRWWSNVRRAAAETALPEVRFDIRSASLNDDAPLWGAVALGLQRII